MGIGTFANLLKTVEATLENAHMTLSKTRKVAHSLPRGPFMGPQGTHEPW